MWLVLACHVLEICMQEPMKHQSSKRSEFGNCLIFAWPLFGKAQQKLCATWQARYQASIISQEAPKKKLLDKLWGVQDYTVWKGWNSRVLIDFRESARGQGQSTIKLLEDIDLKFLIIKSKNLEIHSTCTSIVQRVKHTVPCKNYWSQNRVLDLWSLKEKK